uniref:zinc finger protein 648 n=1 Tax=Callithrix jacchus TaxID=9483 RepID=UPI0023DCF0F0|nr:zinc finger protein 648 [Callithrix jacchus]
MAQVDSQDRWEEASPLSSLTEKAHDPQMLSMNLESEDEGGGESEKEGTADMVACLRGSSQVTCDNPDLPWPHPLGKEEEKVSDSSSARGMGQKPMQMSGRASWSRDVPKINETQGSPGASTVLGTLRSGLTHKLLGQLQPLREGLSAGDDGDLRANQDAALDVPSSFPSNGKYLCAHKSVDTSAENSSLLCFPRPGSNWDLPTRETHTPAQASATPASLAAAVLAKGRISRKGQNQVGRRGDPEAEAHPYRRLRGGRAFQEPSKPLSPVETRGDTKPYACELCGKAYSHRGTLQQHRRLHTGERPYRCSFCDKAYTWSSDHRKHIRTHTGEKPYPCPDCGKAFVRSSDLRKHQRNMHSNDKPFPCSECGLTFNKPLSLLRHQRTHLGAKPFRCVACDREFAVASRMVEHQRVHSGERPFPCPTCGKCFTKSSNLAEHQTLHTGQRPFKCADCGVAFAQPSRLVRHQRIHTGERPFACTQCGQAFARSSTLKRHQQIHSGEKGFLCAECGRAFRIASELAQHIRMHNGERPYQCEDCGQAFTRSNHLQRHQAKHGTCKKEPIPSSSDE